MTFADVREVFRPLEHPADGNTNAVGMTRTLELEDLCVVAHDWLGGTEISVHRTGDDETWITPDEWPVLQQMVADQLEWGRKRATQEVSQ